MRLLTAKDVSNQLGICTNSAYKLIADIKKEYNVKTNKITENHLKKYLNIN